MVELGCEIPLGHGFIVLGAFISIFSSSVPVRDLPLKGGPSTFHLLLHFTHLFLNGFNQRSLQSTDFSACERDRNYQPIQIDHYGSGVAPNDILRRLHVTTSIDYAAGALSYSVFEEKTYSVPGMRSLKMLNLTLTHERPGQATEFGKISPVLKILEAQGVTVNVVSCRRSKWTDLSSLFDEPDLEEL
ncbi:hypothetical protein BU26DRAFT_599938 [Trematosphaeria pertusa]|uniref:Uncharacterized protein n=1 Tax=Trematosphaeria pertusa TaxID=390896 RepID=A0A6A6J412_9PLEO|nr:uncharacterized protein BU26DRAFT_599938 [Trematosphaeria pertusa]KAF2257439.1 hypothetical protein BU26DRAFT_599938 [Trematosphaeria pertusa]